MLPKTWHKLARQLIPRHLRDTYFALASHCFGDKRHCHPSQRRLAAMIDAAPSTVHDHIDKLTAWHVITRIHHGRCCKYELHDPAQWQVPLRRHRMPKVCADCSETHTKDRNTFSVPIRQKMKNHKKYKVSQETRAKRANLIKALRRWVQLSPHLPESERGHRLGVLDRCEAHLDCWHARPAEDRRCFETLVHQARGRPLEGACLQSLRQRPVGMRAIGMVLPVLGGMPGTPAARPLDMSSDLSRS